MDEQEQRDWQWLVGAEAGHWLQLAAAWDSDPVSAAQRLRRELSPDRARLIGELVDLRVRARPKFRRADELFFTRQALEQATDDAIAAWKAQRFAGASRICDICCGIGGDLMALAGQGEVLAVDREAHLLTLAAANVRVAGHAASFSAGEAERLSLSPDQVIHIDPDRRPEGQRVSRPQSADPPLDTVERLVRAAPGAAVKLAPAALAPLDWMESGEREWIERRGECRQQVVWLGSLARHPGRCVATLLDQHGACQAQVSGEQTESAESASSIGRYLLEPSGSVIAAGLVDALACETRLARVAPRIAYLTGDQRVDHPALALFEVLEVLPFDGRRVKKFLRAKKLQVVEVKKRGTSVNPEALCRSLRGTGETPVTLLIAARSQGVAAIIARRPT
jgi:hypothetical protein